MHSVWYNAEIKKCQVCLFMVPNCHHHHLRYNSNRCIGAVTLTFNKPGLPKKTMAMIATWDVHRVSSKRLEESLIPELMTWKLKLTHYREIFLRLSSEKECLRLVCKAVEALIKHLL